MTGKFAIDASSSGTYGQYIRKCRNFAKMSIHTNACKSYLNVLESTREHICPVLVENSVLSYFRVGLVQLVQKFGYRHRRWIAVISGFSLLVGHTIVAEDLTESTVGPVLVRTHDQTT